MRDKEQKNGTNTSRVEVTVIDESNYATLAGTVAAIVIATAQDKTSGTGTGTATGTTAQMQAKHSNRKPLRELTATFGTNIQHIQQVHH